MPVAVTTFDVNYLPIKQIILFPAVLDVNNSATITTIQPGKLARFDIEIGTHVTKGTINW